MKIDELAASGRNSSQRMTGRRLFSGKEYDGLMSNLGESHARLHRPHLGRRRQEWKRQCPH
jgi:hypothetical protein